jgi:uncharacterized protein YqjF (DUF2071 family)
MRQTWHELLFAHRPIAPAAVAPLLPTALTLETFEHQAWLGVVPFHMTGVRARATPPLPGLARFAEINLRTYVVADGKPGVYFFSLDAANPLAVAFARRFFSLPYYRAQFELRSADGTITYHSQRTHAGAPPAEFRAIYRPTGPIYRTQPGSLEHWLTERYCLYTADGRGRLLRGEIHHPPWPLQPAESRIECETLSRAAGLEVLAVPPLLHYAGRLEVLIWPIARV